MTKRCAGFLLFSGLAALIAACGGSARTDAGTAAGAAGQASGGGPSSAGSSAAGASAAGAPSAGAANLADACSAPKVSGQCDAYIPSFWHNPTSGLCEPFIYGGCGGNDNRYQTRDACLSACPNSLNEWGACMGDSDCVLVSPSCCAACEPVTDSGWLALNGEHFGDQMAPCATVGACAPCPQVTEQEATGKYFRPVCVAGHCSALDVRQSAYTECSTDSDCTLRDGVKCCAECDGGFVAVNANANFCPDGPERCAHCASIPPSNLQATCTQNRCVLASVE